MMELQNPTHGQPSAGIPVRPPCGAILGIGSLPMTDPAAAVSFVRKFSPEIPFWPQLPNVSERERIIGQGLGAIHDLIEPREGVYGYQVKPGRLREVLERFWKGGGKLEPSHASGFYSFERSRVRDDFSEAFAIKGQIEGPITLASHLFYKNRSFAGERTLFEAVAAHVSHLVSWQSCRLASLGLPVLLFIDEPGLCIAGLVGPTIIEDALMNGLHFAIQAGRASGAVVGLHCCAAQPFSRMCRLQPDIVSFDAHNELEAFAADPDAREFVRSGGHVAFGLIPTLRRLDGLSGTEIFARWFKAADTLGDPVEIARRSFVSATCGLGLLGQQAAEASFRLGRIVAALVGRLAGKTPDADIPQ